MNDVDIPTSAIPNGNVAASANIVRILPLISQGDGQYNERIGNEIRLKHLDIKMLINYGLANLSTNNNEDTSLGVRVMILRQKDANASAAAIQNFQGNKLLENGLASGAPAAFSGDTFNLLQKINKSKVISKRLSFGKNGLKLTYGNGASTDPTNFPYFMVIGVASTVSTTVPSNNLLRYSYSANASYTDA